MSAGHDDSGPRRKDGPTSHCSSATNSSGMHPLEHKSAGFILLGTCLHCLASVSSSTSVTQLAINAFSWPDV